MLEYCLLLISTEEGRTKFENLYYKYRDSIYNIAMGLVKDHQLACEVLSKSLQIIAIHINELDTSNTKRLENYIYKVVKNTGLNYLKTKHVKNIVYDLNDFEDTFIEENLEDTIIGDETYKKIVVLIYSISETYRDVLSMHYIDGYSDNFIATALSRPRATVRTQIRRGTELLREKLREANLHE